MTQKSSKILELHQTCLYWTTTENNLLKNFSAVISLSQIEKPKIEGKRPLFLSFLFHFNLKPTIGTYILGKCNRVLQGWARKHIPVWLTLTHRPYTCQLSSWFSSRLPEPSHMDRKWMKHPLADRLRHWCDTNEVKFILHFDYLFLGFTNY